jgi:uncharacterized protein
MREFEVIKDHVISKLSSKLPKYLTYHSIDHTLYVLNKAIYIAQKEKVSEGDLYLLKVASLYHDIGFIQDNADHEDVSCEIARTELPSFGFSEKDILKVENLIQATRIPQQPTNHLEYILADADLEYLATDKFVPIGTTLYDELKHFNPNLTWEQWINIQIKFISNHQYHTNYCKRYKEKYKRKNLDMLLKQQQKQQYSKP